MSKKRILLVDDESGFTRLLHLTLPQYEICEENNALKAIQTARKFKPDMIFLDVIMPDADGGTIAAQMQEDPLLRGIPIVFLTAKVQRQEMAAYDKSEAAGVISKPFDPMKLSYEIERLVQLFEANRIPLVGMENVIQESGLRLAG